MAQNQYAVFTRVTSNNTTSWVDPANTVDLTTVTKKKTVTTEMVIRNVTTNTETVIPLMTLNRRAPATGTQRTYKVNTAAANLFATVRFGPVPQVGVRVPELVTIEDPVLSEVATNVNLVQRGPKDTVAVPQRYLFELRRLNEPSAGTPNPVISHTQFVNGLESDIKLPRSLRTVTFPKSFTGNVARWERRTHAVDPFRLIPQGKGIVITDGTIKGSIATERMDDIADPNFVVSANGETLNRGTDAYAARVVCQYLERVGYVNYDAR
jgi:hypothetical protein